MDLKQEIEFDKFIDQLATAIAARQASPKKPRFWDSFDHWFRILAAGGALLTALWGIWQYADAAQREAIKPFLEQRLKNCTEASTAAARIAQPAPASDQVEQQSIFWRLYWGPLAIVESEAVEAEMVRFGRLLQTSDFARQLQAGHDINPAVLNELRQAALRISHACRKMVSDDFALRLPPGLDKLAKLFGTRPAP
ncbi:hypothetical protein P0R31_37020 [Bradyrhizobium yuanmingense]|uniref:hypothetical protein n=1 Tax=Bradyrhizobium yuanmingense TaxID=108015 RepID=UPI0023B8BEFF|nr:hypothetical protein [Bradyrhizobium yuanmingense]MDF0522841.1 hypothetical protein [Bradyrhizobium yuanmingense]